MENRPDFFLTSSEIIPTLSPRKCWILKKLMLIERSDYSLLVQIEPYIMGARINVPKVTINEIILVSRYKEQSLFPLSELPITVYACIVKEENRENFPISARSLINLFIGEIYETNNDALKAITSLTERGKIF